MVGDSNPTFMVFFTFEEAQNFLELYNLAVDYGHVYNDGAQFWFAYDMNGGSADPPDPRHPDTFVAFCDGSALGNGQRNCYGGPACIFPHDGNLDFLGSIDDATNNRAEYQAALTALERVNMIDPNQNNTMYIFGDSKDLVDSMTKWIYNWERNGWITVRGTEVKDRDILEQLVFAQGNRPVFWHHVKAHTNKRDWESFWNAIADVEARRAARQRREQLLS